MGIDARILLKITGPTPTPEQIALWSWDLCAAIGADKFWTNKETKKYAIALTEDYEEQGREGKVYFQDGDTVIAADNETMLDVSLWTRYYGIGYERGDVFTICNTAAWCEQNIPNCTVYYGGDSSGVEAEPFHKGARDALLAHKFGPHGRDYYQEENPFMEKPHEYGKPPPCSLCVPKRGMSRYGWGGNYAAYHCAGCNESFETRDGGATWTKKDKDKL